MSIGNYEDQFAEAQWESPLVALGEEEVAAWGSETWTSPLVEPEDTLVGETAWDAGEEWTRDEEEPGEMPASPWGEGISTWAGSASSETEAGDTATAEDEDHELVEHLLGAGFAAATEHAPGHALGDEAESRADGPAGGASEREAEPERFSGPEHRHIGDLAVGRQLTPITYGTKGDHLTFGEVVALAGDHYATYDELRRFAATARGRADIAWSRWFALELPAAQEPVLASDPQVARDIKQKALERYYSLASRNLSHFSGGGTAWETYVTWHSKALADALAAGEQKDKAAWARALTKEAFGLHFLTDSFSAGHVRTPRAAIRDWYGTHFKDSSDQFIRYMARFMYDRLDERQQLPPLAWWFSWVTRSRIAGRIEVLGGEAIRSFSLGDIVSLALHDYDNRTGLEVVSDVDPDGHPVAGGHHWTAMGDSHLGANAHGAATTRMAVAAVITSLRDLERARGVGVKLAGQHVSSAQRAAALKQALGGSVFAAKGFVPREDLGSKKNVPLPPRGGPKPPFEWRWGQLGPDAYREVDRIVKTRVYDELFKKLKNVDETATASLGVTTLRIHGVRHAFRLFTEHLRTDGIRVAENAVGRKAR